MTASGRTPIALTIAGSDSGGGAGIQADLKTFAACGVYGASVITALTAQNTLGVQAIHDVPASFIGQQLQSVLDDIRVTAVKIGMLSRRGTIAVVADHLARRPDLPVVLDPVMVAASGDPLLRPDAMAAIRSRLMPRADLITPNLHEAAALTGLSLATDEAAMAMQGRILLADGARAVLIKGGHGDGPESVDLLVNADGIQRFAVPRLATRNIHGTGCTLSSAIAAGLARGVPLAEAAAEAKHYITAAIAAAGRFTVGAGHGPAHHFHRWW